MRIVNSFHRVFTILGATVFFFAASGGNSTIVGHWQGEDNALDSGSNGFNGNLLNGVTFAPGRIGTAFSFDGIDDIVEIPDATGLRLGINQTVSLWFKFNGDGSVPNGYNRLAGKGDSTNRNFGLFVFPLAGHILFQIKAGSGFFATECNAQKNGTGLLDSNWHHIAGTYDNVNVRLYLDGVEVANAACSGMPTTSADPMTIGRDYAHMPFLGLVDDVRIFDETLSLREIVLLQKPIIYGAGNDYFLSYDIKKNKDSEKFVKQSVSLQDQFGSGQYEITKAEELLNPASVNSANIFAEDVHLLSYKLKAKPLHKKISVMIENEFETKSYLINDKAERLFVPASKGHGVPLPAPAIGTADHFLCYPINNPGGSLEIAITLEEQFQANDYVVKKAKSLCNPVNKNGEGILKPDNHLLCYTALSISIETRMNAQKNLHIFLA